jgi:hypothetical protein
MGLLYRLTLWLSVCVGLESSGFCDGRSHCQIVGYYRTYITSSVGHLRLDSVRLLVVDDSVQWSKH